MSVVGVILEQETRKPLPGLRVRAYDKDLVRDDDLGDAVTDAAGRFEIRFTEAQFRDFSETAPDLYIRVYTSAGKLVHSTEGAVRKNAGAREVFEVAIPKAMLA